MKLILLNGCQASHDKKSLIQPEKTGVYLDTLIYKNGRWKIKIWVYGLFDLAESFRL